MPSHADFTPTESRPIINDEDLKGGSWLHTENPGDTEMGAPEERRVAIDPAWASRYFEGDGCHSEEDAEGAECCGMESGGRYHCRHIDFLIGTYPKVLKGAIVQGINGVVDPKDFVARMME